MAKIKAVSEHKKMAMGGMQMAPMVAGMKSGGKAALGGVAATKKPAGVMTDKKIVDAKRGGSMKKKAGG